MSFDPAQVAATMKQVVPWIETNGVDFVEVTVTWTLHPHRTS